MLDILRSRMHNEREKELSIAAGEQDKITRLRLDKLMKEHDKEMFVMVETGRGVGGSSSL